MVLGANRWKNRKEINQTLPNLTQLSPNVPKFTHSAKLYPSLPKSTQLRSLRAKQKAVSLQHRTSRDTSPLSYSLALSLRISACALPTYFVPYTPSVCPHTRGVREA